MEKTKYYTPTKSLSTDKKKSYSIDKKGLL